MLKQIIIISALLFSTNMLIAQNSQKYPVKSGLIVYKLSGIKSGIEINYFDDYGRLSSHFQVFNNASSDYDSIYSILNNDTITFLNVSTHIAKYTCLTDGFNKSKQDVISDSVLYLLGYTNVGNENIIDKNCTKYKSNNGLLWVWNSFVVKSEMDIMGTKISKEATKVAVDITIPKNKFDIPKDYSFNK